MNYGKFTIYFYNKIPLSSLYRITNLDREKGTHLYNKRSDFRKEFCVLEEHELKLLSERKQESKLNKSYRSLYLHFFLLSQ